MIEIKNSQQTSASISLADGKGAKKTAININFSIRPNEGMNIMLEIQDRSLLTEENFAEVQAEIDTYLQDELIKARMLGIPVAGWAKGSA